MADYINTPQDDNYGLFRTTGTLTKKVKWSVIKNALKTYFGQFYNYTFKTINGQSIVGSGDITISGGGPSFHYN